MISLKMADTGKQEDDKNETKNETSNSSSGNLEDFVTGHYKKQKDNGQIQATPEIDDKRAEDFFSRAIAESRRMNAEVDKSHKKMEKLHAEFGADRVAAWQAEHAAEVLTPSQIQALSIDISQNS